MSAQRLAATAGQGQLDVRVNKDTEWGYGGVGRREREREGGGEGFVVVPTCTHLRLKTVSSRCTTDRLCFPLCVCVCVCEGDYATTTTTTTSQLVVHHFAASRQPLAGVHALTISHFVHRRLPSFFPRPRRGRRAHSQSLTHSLSRSSSPILQLAEGVSEWGLPESGEVELTELWAFVGTSGIWSGGEKWRKSP